MVGFLIRFGLGLASAISESRCTRQEDLNDTMNATADVIPGGGHGRAPVGH